MHETLTKLTSEIKTALIQVVNSPEAQALIAKTKEARDSGSFEVVVSTHDTDRQGESVDQAGWDLTHYKENPVVLWGHDYCNLPIGITEDIEVKDGKLVARGRFAPQEANPFAQQVRRLYDLKIVRATSVGFIAREMDGSTIKQAELLEFSFVPVPANPYALSLEKAHELGLDLAVLKAKGLEFEIEPRKDKGAVSDALNQDADARDRKWQRLERVLGIMDAFVDVYLGGSVKVEAFDELLNETIELLKNEATASPAPNGEVEAMVGKAGRRVTRDRQPNHQNGNQSGAVLSSRQRGAGGEESSENRENPNQRSQDAGLKHVIAGLDQFLTARNILRSFTTQATDALERMNKHLRSQRKRNV